MSLNVYTDGRMRCVLMLAVVAVAAIFAGEARAMVVPQCHPSLLQSGTDRIRRVCAALSSILENAMESYLDDKGTLQTYENLQKAFWSPCCQMLLRENAPLMDSGVKRQDVDHVFLRFGRR